MANGVIGWLASLFGVKRRASGQDSRLRDAGDRARDRGDWIDAIFNYRSYLETNPEMFPIWVQLGHVSKEAGDPVAAEQAYLARSRSRPTTPICSSTSGI